MNLDPLSPFGPRSFLGNKCYILFLQGNTDQATAVLREAIRLGGEDLRNVELGDAEINTTPHDDAFKTLVRIIPGA